MSAPDHWSGDVIPAQDYENHAIRFDSLYVREPTRFSELRHRYRFWPGGRVMVWLINWDSERGELAEPRLTEPTADDFDGGLPGIYAVHGNQIDLEFAGFDESGRHYIHSTGTIEKDGLIKFGAVQPNNEEDMGQPVRFKPVPVSGMLRMADW